MIESMKTNATTEIDVRTGVPIASQNAEGFTCDHCLEPADETKSLWYLRTPTGLKVWHPACRTIALKLRELRRQYSNLIRE